MDNHCNLDLGAFNQIINPSTFYKVGKFNLQAYQHVIVARSRSIRDHAVAMRLRIGRVGYIQWLNELNVYMLPDFRHQNILPYLGCDKRYLESRNDVFNSSNILEENEKDSKRYHSNSDSDSDSDKSNRPGPSGKSTGVGLIYRGERDKNELKMAKEPIEYWIVNDFSYCQTLRHYITRQSLSWDQMIMIARGIANGLHYLHEHYTYKNIDFNNDRGAQGLIEETDEKLKAYAFRATRGTVRIQPPNLMTIIHRSLSSLSIVLRSDLTPCIWNFGTAHVYHPYQPINYLTAMDGPNQIHTMHSVYTPPEILKTSSVFTQRAARAVDMYALGFVFWEMLSRCRLPPIVSGMAFDNVIRENPSPYAAPLVRELKTEHPSYNLLYRNISLKKIRPTLKPSWLRGKKSHRFTNTIKDLWDEDYDARITVSTVIERLSVMSLNSKTDKRVIIPDHVGIEPEVPTTAQEMGPHEHEEMPTAGEPPIEAVPRLFDRSEPREEVRCQRIYVGTSQRPILSRKQQRIYVQRQLQMQRELYQRHPPRSLARGRARTRGRDQGSKRARFAGPEQRRSVRLAARPQPPMAMRPPMYPQPPMNPWPPMGPPPPMDPQPSTSTGTAVDDPAGSSSS